MRLSPPRALSLCLALGVLAGSPAAVAAAPAATGAMPASAGAVLPAAERQPFGAIRIDAGGLKTTGEWSYDVNVSGGWSGHENPQLPTDLSKVTDPGPADIYPSYRYGDTTYTFSYLNPAQNYRLRLHFNEPATWVTLGRRLFDVGVNGTTVLPSYDIVKAAGARDTAVIENLDVRSDATGTLKVTFRNVRGGAIVAGLELAVAGAPVGWPAPAVAQPRRFDVGERTPAPGWSANIGVGALAGSTNRTTYRDRRIDTRDVTGAAPQEVYQAQREGEATYRIDGLTPGAAYTLRLHLAETRYKNPGERVFDVAINGTTRLIDYDILAHAGARDRAYVEELVARADEAGTITVATSALDRKRPPTLAGLEVTERHELFAPGRSVRVMAVGDSITAGVGYPASGGFRVPLFTAMAARGWGFETVGPNVGPPTTPLQILSPYTASRWAGAGGWSTNDIIGTTAKRNKTGAGIATWIRDADPDVLLLHIGTNDVLGDWDKEENLTADYAALLDAIYAAKPQIKVFAATPLQFAANRDYPTILALGRIVEREAAARTANGQRMYAVPMQNALPERRYYSDGVHPSRLGYETMAKVWLDALVAADES